MVTGRGLLFFNENGTALLPRSVWKWIKEGVRNKGVCAVWSSKLSPQSNKVQHYEVHKIGLETWKIWKMIKLWTIPTSVKKNSTVHCLRVSLFSHRHCWRALNPSRCDPPPLWSLTNVVTTRIYSTVSDPTCINYRADYDCILPIIVRIILQSDVPSAFIDGTQPPLTFHEKKHLSFEYQIWLTDDCANITL